MPATTSIENWNFEEFHVQRELDANDFLNAASTLIAAGPPKLSEAGNANLASGANIAEIASFAYPVGVLENAAVAQNKQLQRLFEIGSKRSYFVTGRTVGSLTLARTLFHGPSLLRVLYSYYPSALINSSVQDLLSTEAPSSANQIVNQPGYADLFTNLDSDLFDHPFGLFFLFDDSQAANTTRYGGFYLEMAYLNAHQMNVSSTSVLLAEGATIQFDRLVPVNVGAETRSEVARAGAGGASAI